MNSIKIRYTFKRKMDGRISQQVLTIEELETKHFLKTLEISHDLIARDLWTGKRDANGNDIFNNDIIDWGDNFNSKVYYDYTECAFRIEEIGVMDGEIGARTHDLESYTTPPTILGNIYTLIL